MFIQMIVVVKQGLKDFDYIFFDSKQCSSKTGTKVSMNNKNINNVFTLRIKNYYFWIHFSCNLINNVNKKTYFIKILIKVKKCIGFVMSFFFFIVAIKN